MSCKGWWEALRAALGGRGGAQLTEAQAVSREFPLAGIIGQVLALLLQGHLARVHDDGEVAGLDVCMGRLQESPNTEGEKVPHLLPQPAFPWQRLFHVPIFTTALTYPILG